MFAEGSTIVGRLRKLGARGPGGGRAHVEPGTGTGTDPAAHTALAQEKEERFGAAKTVVFVCTANICRSPMAEHIFNALACDRGLPFRAESAGVAALVDRSMDHNALRALEEVGIYVEGHRARQLDRSLLERADLVLAMNPRHVSELLRLCGEPSGPVATLSGYANDGWGEGATSDPHRYTMATYRASVRHLLKHVDLALKRLEEGGP